MKKNICESRLGVEYISDVLSSCEQNGVQCIVDDANGIFYVYDNREADKLLYCTSKDIMHSDTTIFDMFCDKEEYDNIMLPGNGDKFKEFCVTWNGLQKKSESDEVFKTNGCKPILGLTMESDEEDVVEGIPNWATFYIMYGDDSGLDEADKRLVDNFLNDLDKDNIALVSPIDGTENEFNAYPAFGDGCNTTDWSCRMNANANESIDGKSSMNASMLKNVLSEFDQNKEVEVVDYTTGETIGIVNKVGVLDNVIYVTKKMNANESIDDEEDENDMKEIRYRWIASSDDGAWEEESSRTWNNQQACYMDMMEHAIDKMKWNVEWDDVTSDCNAFEEDGLIKTDGEMNSQGDQIGGDTWGIYYQLECHPHMIQHLSGSGLYTYKIETVSD